MKVKELIEELKKLPEDSMVVVSGYEGGVDEVTNLDEVKLTLHVNNVSYYGAHEIEDGGKTPAVHIW